MDEGFAECRIDSDRGLLEIDILSVHETNELRSVIHAFVFVTQAVCVPIEGTITCVPNRIERMSFVGNICLQCDRRIASYSDVFETSLQSIFNVG